MDNMIQADQENDQAILSPYLQVLPVIGELMDVAFLLCDREKYLFIKSSTSYTVTSAKPGIPVKSGTAVKAMAERRRVVSRVDKADVGTGVSIYSSSIPIYNNNGEVVGAAIAVESIEKQEAVRDMATTLNQAITTLACNSEEISAQSEEISGVSRVLVGKVTESLSRVRETNQILELIKGIASQTNLLGLNAAIEAARVGEQGRGFGVVAQEIRKLSDNTSESIRQIENVIKAIQADSEYNKVQLEQIVGAISQIASAVNDTAITVQKTSALSARLNDLAEDMDKSK